MRRLFGLLAAAVFLAALPGCSTGPSLPVLTVLAGSELKDLAPLMPDLEKNVGYHLQMNYIGTLDGAEKIASGDKSDLAWFSSGNYLALLPATANKIAVQQRIMLSPVVIGVKHSKAVALGWAGNPNVRWSDIAVAARSGQFHFAMTNPTASNSGFVGLLGVATALNNGSDLPDTYSPQYLQSLKDFFSGQAMTAGSSGFLADSYVRSQDSLDGIINYESILLGLNRGNQLRDKLDLVYPKEGIITADYPLMLLNRGQRAAYDKLVAYLTAPAVQQRIMTETSRRPVVPTVTPDGRFTSQLLVELPFPRSLDSIDKLLIAYLDQIKPPSHEIFVIDISGSMAGDRINAVKAAFDNLTGGDQTLTGQFARFRQRERVTIIPFNGRVVDNWTVTINDASQGSSDVRAVRNYVDSLQPDDGTAIYDALVAAYQVVQRSQPSEPGTFFSIVLMTDGENNQGRNGDQFASFYRGLPGPVREVRTFAIVYGEASPAELNKVASLTGGTTFDGRHTSLAIVYKQIRGYQ